MYRNRNIYEKKGSNKLAIALTVLIVLCLGISVCYLFVRQNKGKETMLYATWICSEIEDEESRLAVKISDNYDIEMYYPDDKTIMDIPGKYTIDSKDQNDNNLRYTITITSASRTVAGKTVELDYKKVYTIDIDTNEPNNMTYADSKQSNTFICSKE